MNIPRFRAARFSWIPFFAFALSGCGQNKNAHAIIHTGLGDIGVRLFDSTPRHRDNFIALTETTPHDTLLFNRIERDFAIQFGPSPNLVASQKHALAPEIEAPLLTGALAAAKDTSPGYSDGANFFIVLGRPQTDASLDDIERKTSTKLSAKERNLYKKHGGLPQLHGQYTVLGEVTSGIEVAEKIAALPRDAEKRPLQKVGAWVEIGGQ